MCQDRLNSSRGCDSFPLIVAEYPGVQGSDLAHLSIVCAEGNLCQGGVYECSKTHASRTPDISRDLDYLHLGFEVAGRGVDSRLIPGGAEVHTCPRGPQPYT